MQLPCAMRFEIARPQVDTKEYFRKRCESGKSTLRAQRLNKFKILKFSSEIDLVDVSDIFNFFLLGEGESEALGGGGSVFYWKSQAGGRGKAEGVSAANWGIWGGGAKSFFSGPKCPPSWNFQASHPPNPYFCGESWSSGLKILNLRALRVSGGHWGLSNVRNCLQVSSFCDDIPFTEGAKRP